MMKKEDNAWSNLENAAEEIKKLKEDVRQRRPIVIEFSGSPKAGKTTCINTLKSFLKRNGFVVEVVQERAGSCPVSDKTSPMFNTWTACMTLAGLIGITENKDSKIDVLLLDRGLFDAACWFEWIKSTGRMGEKQLKIDDQFFLGEDCTSYIDIVFLFSLSPQESMEREFNASLSKKQGSIMNEVVLSEFNQAMENVYSAKKDSFQKIIKIEADKYTQDTIGLEVTKITLSHLKELLMEQIGYFNLTDDLRERLNGTAVHEKELTGYLGSINFGMRESVEKMIEGIQPIPIAVLTNQSKTTILAVKKSKNAAQEDSPEFGKRLLYVGGHVRKEDCVCSQDIDLIEVFRRALKRELKEEIGTTLAIDNVSPIYIYSPTSEKSSKHLAVCFIVVVDENNIKFRIDSGELLPPSRGKSKSGTFVSVEELQADPLEEWSSEILHYFFSPEGYNGHQYSIDEYSKNSSNYV